MESVQTHIKDCFFLRTEQHHDSRGFFEELFNQSVYNLEAKQVNRSFSHQGTIRGIHISPYFKLITCISGSIFDVCVDLRKDSPSYLRHFSIVLDDENRTQLYCPPYCGHAFLALKESEIIYTQGGIFNQSCDVNVLWNDEAININWPVMDQYILSSKDSTAPRWMI